MELDLEKFFDRVNHDVLMAKIDRHIEDRHVLRLIRRYLEAGFMSGGIASRRQEGMSQGGLLLLLLSNILLDELDRELEWRGHRFVRYVDDAKHLCVQLSRWRAGVERFLSWHLKLAVNREKIHVAQPWVCDCLGYGVSWHQQPRLRVMMSLNRLRDRLRILCGEHGVARWSGLLSE
ncbi:reverse transcriptase domain-containing protein [Pseudomonas veronii]|uniref:reverse transcriptase domain-containing protein n=1 Tax=Pseudomonas veronii TaxID=76761 RepID=UPI003D81B0D0